MDTTLQYYNDNTDSYVSDTCDVDFSKTQNHFLNLLPPNACILDFGCGSGRDVKWFSDHGYQVDATDGSAEMCKAATAYTGLHVKQMLFRELSSVERYDGIWACASILHLPKEELRIVMGKMAAALKSRGIIYCSFKYGTFEGMRRGRYFTDFTENTFQEFMKNIGLLEIEEQWVTSDVRSGRECEKWLNNIIRKSEHH